MKLKIQIPPSEYGSSGLTIVWKYGYFWIGDIQESHCFGTLDPTLKEEHGVLKILHDAIGKSLQSAHVKYSRAKKSK